ncbi:MAG: DUF3021 family protein [Spirochaetaceae bacterium]|nr:DUF3021 family protein [Spirochaetaceae bacterium]
MKEKIALVINIFTRVCTAIFVLATIYTTIFFGAGAHFRMSDIWYILLIGAISAVCYIPFLANGEYSKLTMILMQIGYFLVINVCVLAIGFKMEWFSAQNTKTVIGFETIIILVYVLVSVLSYKIESDAANKMNKLLKNRNHKN